MANIRRSALFAALVLVLFSAHPALAGPEYPPVCPYVNC